MNRQLLAVLALAALPLAAAPSSAAKTPNRLWYKQPAQVDPVPLPWAKDVPPPDRKDAPASQSWAEDAAPTPNAPAKAPGGHASPNLPPKPLNKSAGTSWASQSLPVGNGRVGGTVFGGDTLERVTLNEISLWTGGPNLPKNGAGYAYGPTSGKEQFGSYQPFGDLYIDFKLPEGGREDYVRQLNLENAVATTSFTVDGTEHIRSCFVSHPDDLLIYRADTQGGTGKINARIALMPYHSVTYSPEGQTIIMGGSLANGERFEGRLVVKVEGGSLKLHGGKKDVMASYAGKAKAMRPVVPAEGLPYLEVKNATSFTAYVTLATDYKMDYASQWKGESPDKHNKKVLARALRKDLKELLADHIADHARLFKRMSLTLGETDPAREALPTDERLAAYRQQEKPSDPALEALLFQYGRYVLIAGSRPGNLPLTLQGIWNDMVHAPWASDYHNNINLQMCYWGAEVGNLSECHMPFIDYMQAMEKPLEEMTRKEFGEDIRGWTTRISQNPWGGGGWTKWNPPVNAWYALHVWDHYLFTQDKEYLRKVGYPLLRNICAFWETSLKELGAKGEGLTTAGGKQPLKAAEHPELEELPAGTLVSPMGWSHEWGPVEDGCMHDQQLVWELFDSTAKAAKVLGVDKEWAEEILAKRDKLAPNRVAKGGYLQEWIVDRPNMVKGQRHTSHLIGVFPGSTISMAKTPEFAKAAAKSLELRGLTADNRRSWTWPWRTALWARLGEPETAHSMVEHYIRYNLLDNLFGNHAPMQMDGTYGITGGIAEMLIQSHAGQIELLPALPQAWQSGSVKGIRARGNITVDMEWKDGKVTDYRLTSSSARPQPVKLVVNGEEKTVRPESSAKKGRKKARRKGRQK